MKKPVILPFKEWARQKQMYLIKESDVFSRAEAGFPYRENYMKYDILLDGRYNLYAPIRKDVVEYFQGNKISFWKVAGEPNDKPSGHTLSSQIACLNHLFPIRNDKDSVLKVAQKICPDFVAVLPIEIDKCMPAYIAFEVVSDKDHLNEGASTRGANCTSIDALIYAVHKKVDKYIIPIEWKYTESYQNQDKSVEDRKSEPKGTQGKGRERLERYSDLIAESDYLKSLGIYRSSVYFFEPFYQLMRQTLWAEQMIKHSDSETIKADNFIHADVIPKDNEQLLKQRKRKYFSGEDMETTWRGQLKCQNNYAIITPEKLLSALDKTKYGDLLEYLTKRYWNVPANYEDLANAVTPFIPFLPTDHIINEFFEQAVGFAQREQFDDAIKAAKTALSQYMKLPNYGYEMVYIIGFLCQASIDSGHLDKAEQFFKMGMQIVELGKEEFPDDYDNDLNSFLDLKGWLDDERKNG